MQGLRSSQQWPKKKNQVSRDVTLEFWVNTQFPKFRTTVLRSSSGCKSDSARYALWSTAVFLNLCETAAR